MKIEFQRNSKTDKKLRDNPETRTEKIYQAFDQRPYLSAIGVILSGWILFQIIPFGFFAFLPEWAFKYLKITFYAAIPSWIFARKIANRLWTLPVDIIYVGDPEEKEITKAYRYKKGKFKEEYDFEGGEPLTWENCQGLRCYQVVEIDHENKEARSPWISDLQPWEILKFRENWSAQKIWNDRQREKAAELELKMDQIKSKVRAEVSNAWIRELETLEGEESVSRAARSALPENIQPEEDIQLENIMEDLEGPQDLSDKIEEQKLEKQQEARSE